MTLDRQKILNELGSVMNQLKSTDCGCMQKLFGDTNKNVTPIGNIPSCGSHRHGCCHSHGYGPSLFGGSYTNNTQNMQRSCMGQCNPPKLYADTYNYLSENLVQPTINEVYNELKTITPANTVMNNPMAKQLGVSKEQFVAHSNIPEYYQMGHKNRNLNTGVAYSGGNNIPNHIAPTSNPNLNQIEQVEGIGPQIMNMIGGNQISKQSNIVPKTQQFYPKAVESQNYPNNIRGNPVPNYNNAIQDHVYHTNQSNNMTLNPQSQHQNANQYHLHGQHAQGIAKFKEIFPGVMKNDLGFDPMSIAIQMNPENQKQVAMDTLHKMMNANNRFPNTNENTNTVQPTVNIPVSNDYVQPNQTGDSFVPKQDVLQQQIYPIQESANQPSTNLYGSTYTQPNQQAYTALTKTPDLNQQFIQSQQQPIPNLSSGFQSTVTSIHNDQTGFQSQEMAKSVPEIPKKTVIKEPLLPADKSRFVMPISKQKFYEYNTLGQPIEMLPAKIYHTPEPGLPQTLSPQPKIKYNFTKYCNVKSTVSKTSLMGIKPVGKTPSRNQLQQIYNNYKGSHSYTQQNVNPSRKEGTHSDRQLNVPRENIISHQVERISGDTLDNNQANTERIHKVEHVMDQIGDAPVTEKPFPKTPEKGSPDVQRKCRNGLQDIIYTSYTAAAAWSFHGDGRVSRSTGRYRNKI